MVSTLSYIWVLAQMLAELFDFCTICIYTILLCTFFVLNTLQRGKYGISFIYSPRINLGLLLLLQRQDSIF